MPIAKVEKELDAEQLIENEMANNPRLEQDEAAAIVQMERELEAERLDEEREAKKLAATKPK